MWLLNKISCEIQILNEKVGKLMIENGKLEEENKKMKEELDYYKRKSEWFSKIIAKYQEENKKLREDVKELKETLEHRDSVLSIMYDLLRSDLSDYEQLCMIDVVIDVEVGNEPQNKLREELLDRFWKRDF